MTEQRHKNISTNLCYLLRHAPEAAGLDMDSKGEWYTISEVTHDFTNPEETLYMLAQDFEKWDGISQEEI